MLGVEPTEHGDQPLPQGCGRSVLTRGRRARQDAVDDADADQVLRPEAQVVDDVVRATGVTVKDGRGALR
jgi:hypothetical protein